MFSGKGRGQEREKVQEKNKKTLSWLEKKNRREKKREGLLLYAAILVGGGRQDSKAKKG